MSENFERITTTEAREYSYTSNEESTVTINGSRKSTKVSASGYLPASSEPVLEDTAFSLDSIKHDVDQHYLTLQAEVDKLTSLKGVFETRRQQSQSHQADIDRIKSNGDKLDKNLTALSQTLEEDKSRVQATKKQRDTEHQDLSKQAQKATDEHDQLVADNKKEREALDKQFQDSVFKTDSTIQDLLDKVSKAKRDLAKERKDVRRLENELDQTLASDNQDIMDFSDNVTREKDPRYDPDELKRTQEENHVLKERLAKLDKNKELMAKQISNVDDEIYRLNKQKNNLYEHQSYNLSLKQERDEVKNLVEASTKRQKQLYDDNIDKLRQIKELEIEIVTKDEEILTLVTQSTIKSLQATLTSDLKDRLRELEEGIKTVDKGTTKLGKDISQVRNKVDDPKFAGQLDNLLGKTNDLSSRNSKNGDTKDKLREDIQKLEKSLDSLDPSKITSEQIEGYKNDLNDIDSTLSSAETLKDQHLGELANLNADFSKLKNDICDQMEKEIREVQKKDSGLLDDTTKTANSAKNILDDLDSKIEDDNPYMRKFARKLNDAKSKLNQINYDNDKNKQGYKEQTGRKNGDDDDFPFLHQLKGDATDLDEDVEDNKKRADELMDLLKALQDEFDEANCQTKDEIIDQCRQTLNARLDELADLEQKMKKLEAGVDESTKVTDQALKVLDKSSQDHKDIASYSQVLKDLGAETKNLRADKDDVTDELKRLQEFLNRPDLRQLPMSDILKLQEDTNNVSDKHIKTSDGIDHALDSLKDIQYNIDRILENLKRKLKQETDQISDDINGRLEKLHKFLNPTTDTPDSVQRPKRVKDLLNSTPIQESDSDYGQYQEYHKLTDDNLVRCKQATDDLDILDREVATTLRDYQRYNGRDQGVVDQIKFFQDINKKLGKNAKPSKDLSDVVDGILAQLDGNKEQEIIDFLNRIKSQKLDEARAKFKKADLDLSELDKRLREVNGNNEGFMDVLNKANDNPKNKERVNLINTLLRESDDSKKDLKKIKADKDKLKVHAVGKNDSPGKGNKLFDTMYQKLHPQNPDDIRIKDLDDIMNDLEQCEQLIAKKLEELDTIDQDIEERKKRWQDYLTNTEAKEKLVNELLSLIPLLREKYERLSKNTNFCGNSIAGFIKVNDSIGGNEHYITDKAPCPNRNELSNEMKGYETKINEYGPQVDRLEGYDAQQLKVLPAEDIEGLIVEATNLIKNLDSDNHELDKVVAGLREDRKSLKDADIYNNHTRIDQHIGEADKRLQALISEFESLKETLNNTPISNPKLQKSFDDIESNIVKSSGLLETSVKEFNQVTGIINKESMDTAKLAVVADVIDQLGNISKNLAELEDLLGRTEEIFKELQSDLIELYYAKRLNDLKNQINMLLDRLSRLNDLIDKLIELSKALEGYTSDNEEDEFVNDLENELAQVKRQHTSTEEQLKEIAKEVERLQAQLKEDPPNIDEEKAEDLQAAITDVSGMVEGIERLVDSKIQRFADMDPYKKFMRRQKEYKKLSMVLEDRERMINELKAEAGNDLKNPDAGEELKQVCSEVLDELDPLEDELDSLKQRMSLLGNEIEGYLDKSAKTEMTIDEIFDLLYANVEIKKKLKLFVSDLDEFSKNLADLRKKYMVKKAEAPPKKNYKAAKGDAVDEMLGDWINTHGCELEIKRLGNGFYMFGEKKIFAKIINGKLIIRVGGGYMNIDEFMKHYGMMELARQQRIYEMEYESLNYDELMSTEDDMSQPENRGAAMGIAEAKKQLRGSFRGSVKGSFKGSPGRTSPKAGRHGSPKTMTNKGRPASPRVNQNRPGSPSNAKGKSFVQRTMPSAAKIEESLRKMEEDAKEGKLKEGYTVNKY